MSTDSDCRTINLLIEIDTSKNRVLYLGKDIFHQPIGGRRLLCKLNQVSLQKIYGNNLMIFELTQTRLSGIKEYINAFRGYIDGINEANINILIKLIEEHQITQIFVDGSNLGGFTAALKQKISHLEITTFFHNVEARFFWGSFRSHKSLHALGVLIANYLAERMTVKYSDKLVCLCDRDSRLLKKLYGRSATHISPMALEDRFPQTNFKETPNSVNGFAIFVGGSFYANSEGIAWFVREVVPRIKVHLFIVGHGFEALRAEFEVPDKVTVVGAVDSLENWYRSAQFVIAPIFDGSGMKTKVAEALMHGKKIVGTPEAFSGYEDVVKEAGWVCNTADEFVTAIAEAHTQITQTFNPTLRGFYEKYYSMAAAQARLREILA